MTVNPKRQKRVRGRKCPRSEYDRTHTAEYRKEVLEARVLNLSKILGTDEPAREGRLFHTAFAQDPARTGDIVALSCLRGC